jgi:hypothetical protein
MIRLLAKPFWRLLVGVITLAVFASPSAEAMSGKPAGSLRKIQSASVRSTPPCPQTVTPEKLQPAIHRYLTDLWAGKVSKVRVQVTSAMEPICVSKGRLGFRPGPLAKVVRPGPIRLRVSILVNGVVVRNMIVAVDSKVFAPVVVTTRRIQAGETLSEKDVTIGERRVRAIEHGLVVLPEEAAGRKILLSLREGRPIPRIALEPRA